MPKKHEPISLRQGLAFGRTNGKIAEGLARLNKKTAPEKFQPLFCSKTVKIERILSRGHVTPKGKWLSGRKNEWVMVLSGAAKLKFKTGRLVVMKPGSHVLIRAGRAHRVEWTKPGVQTVWFAVYF